MAIDKVARIVNIINIVASMGVFGFDHFAILFVWLFQWPKKEISHGHALEHLESSDTKI